jgi:hypothetical protein
MTDLREIFAQTSKETPCLAFSGALSRTWYEDEAVIADVMAILAESRPYIWVVAGRIPFDNVIEKVAGWVGIEGYCLDEDLPWKKRLASCYQASDALIDACDALIVFPGNPGRSDEQLDPVVSRAVEAGVLVGASYRSGKFELWR